MEGRIKLSLATLVLALLSIWSTRITAATIAVTNTADSGAGSLRAALASAANGDMIDATGVSGTITLTSGELSITNGVSINGPGRANLAIDGNFPNTTNRVFHITNATTVSISGLTITNGNNHDGGGGGIQNIQSTLTLSNCSLVGNSANPGGGGGGIISFCGSSSAARLTLINCIISGNSAEVGGGIYNYGIAGPTTLIVVGSTITNNFAGDAGGGGIKNQSGGAGFAVNGTLSITNSTIIKIQQPALVAVFRMPVIMARQPLR
jgi:hypothetical protein